MARWFVITPEYGEVDPILDDGTGPIEYGCDVVVIETERPRDAKALGVKYMLQKFHKFKWCKTQREDGCSPYAGVKVEPAGDNDE